MNTSHVLKIRFYHVKNFKAYIGWTYIIYSYEFFPFSFSYLCNFVTVDLEAQLSVGMNCAFGSGALVYLGLLLTDVIILYMLPQEFKNFVYGGELNK